MSNLLEISDLRVGFDRGGAMSEVLHGLNLSLKRGEALGLVGESGSGKSVAALSILRLLGRHGKITGGRILFDGRDLAQCAEQEMRKVRGRDIAMIFQDPTTALNPALTIGTQIRNVMLAHGDLSGLELRQEALASLERVGFPHPERALRAYPHELSGGMRQRAMIAMAIACRPKLVLADEPTTALDVTVQAQIVQLLRTLVKDLDLGLIFITHNLDLMAELCDRAVVLYRGDVVESGRTEDLIRRPTHAYTRLLFDSIPRIEEHPAATAEQATQESVGLTWMSKPKEEVFRLTQVGKTYPRAKSLMGRLLDRTQVPVLRGVDLRLHRGDCLGIVGESGSGKTTLARLLVALIEPSSGTLTYRGSAVRSQIPQEIHHLREHVQMVFQSTQTSLNPRKSIRTTLIESIRPGDPSMTLPKLLQMARLPPEILDRLPHQLSGGQRQRVGIARAIARRPEVIVADEPTSALDVSLQGEVIQLLRELHGTKGLTLVVISHDLAMVASLCHEVIVMHQGRIVESGPAANVLRSPQHAYTRRLIDAIPKGLADSSASLSNPIHHPAITP